MSAIYTQTYAKGIIIMIIMHEKNQYHFLFDIFSP